MSFLGFFLIFLLFLFSAFFSGTETALFSFQKDEHKNFSKSTHLKENLIGKFLGHHRRLLITILTGNTIINIMIATISAVFVHQKSAEFNWSPPTAIALEVAVVTILLLIFGEVLPKIFAVRHPQKFSGLTIYPFVFFWYALFPVVAILQKFTSLFTDIAGIDKEVPFDSEEELETLVIIGEKTGTIDKTERQMIEAVFDFGAKTAKDVMVPVSKIRALVSTSTMGDLFSLNKRYPHRCYPVFRESIKNIQGYVYTKHSPEFFEEEKLDDPIKHIIRPAYYIPGDRPLDTLLRDFQRKRIKTAIVIDESGDTIGLVTTEDIFEEIVGEIEE